MARPATSSKSHVNPWKRRALLAAGGLAVIGFCVAVRSYTGASPAAAQIPNPFRVRTATNQAEPAAAGQAQQASAVMPRPGRSQHEVVAVVNGQEIRRETLAAACVERSGEDILEGLVNKRLVMHHCRNRNIEVTPQEIDAEIDRMAARFKLGREQWLDLLQRERGINVEQYKHDVLWLMLALRKLAAHELVVTEEDITKAYESKYGPAVKCRLLVVPDRALAQQLHRQLVDRPEDFARLAMQHSHDVNSASIGGLIQPIRRHVGDEAIEREVFSLGQNQISSIIQVGDQYAILKCEGRDAPRPTTLESVHAELTEQLKEEKLRDVASGLFERLQSSATIQNVWNNPELRAQMPGVVATVNGEQIRYQELAEECLLRFGPQVLEAEISHLLLQQTLSQANLAVTNEDLNQEMAHAAQISGVVDPQGRPDLAKWVQLATEEQGVTRDAYLRDSVWPSAALKKLTGATIEVTPEDLQKGYEANFSERVRCRAIVLGNMRRAQEVWAKARQNPSVDFFGDLAEEYSIEPTSKALRGEVPPIQRHGGQPQLEKVAFDLAPGELSGIIQLADKFVILKCEGRTEPIEVNPQEVREILRQDIFEKKLRQSMSAKFEEIRSAARIDNFLAGTSQAPNRGGPAANGGDSGGAGTRVDSAVRPTSTGAAR